MKRGLIFCIFSLFVLSGCGGDGDGASSGDETNSGEETNSGTETSAGYSLSNAKAEAECNQGEKNLLDWTGWKQPDLNQLGVNPQGTTNHCVQIDVDETNSADVSELNKQISTLNKSLVEDQTMCKWTSSGNNHICKSSNRDVTQIKHEFIAHYASYDNFVTHRCPNRNNTCVEAGRVVTQPVGGDVIQVTDRNGNQDENVKVMINNSQFMSRISDAQGADKSVCFYFASVSNVLRYYLCSK